MIDTKNYVMPEEIIDSVEVYSCVCCNSIITTDQFDWIYCSQLCAEEYDELGAFAICG